MRYFTALICSAFICSCGEEATVGDHTPSGGNDALAYAAITQVVGHAYLNSDGMGGVTAAVALGKPAFDLPEGPTADQCAARDFTAAGLLGALNGLVYWNGTEDLGAPVTLSAGGRTLDLPLCTETDCSGFEYYVNQNLTSSDYLSGQAYDLQASNAARITALNAVVEAAPEFGVTQPVADSTFTPNTELSLSWSGQSDGFMYVLIVGSLSSQGDRDIAIECVLKDDGDYTVSASDIGLLSGDLGSNVRVEFNRMLLVSQEVAALNGKVVGVSVAETNIGLNL